VTLRASPVDVAPLLRQTFDGHPGPLVFTSATLSAAGSFGYMRERLGLADTAAEAVYPSPFRYREQALLYIAEDLPDPTHEAFAEAAAKRALELCRLSRGRALLLFTSFRNLRIAEQLFRADDGFPFSCRANVRARRFSPSCARGWARCCSPRRVFGRAWTCRAKPCRSSPSIACLCRSRRSLDGSAHRRHSRRRRRSLCQLPDPARRPGPQQGFGRLIRSRKDRGVVAILDGRILRKNYGGTLLGGLPEHCPRNLPSDDVRGFFR